MDQKNLMKLILILRKNGISYYKDKDVELKLELDVQPKKSVGSVAPSEISTPEEPKQPSMTEEDFMYWSSGYDPREGSKPVDPENN